MTVFSSLDWNMAVHAQLGLSWKTNGPGSADDTVSTTTVPLTQLPTRAQEKQRPLNPAFLHCSAVVDMSEQHTRYRKVPAPRPKFHLPPVSGLSMTGSGYSTWLPEVSGDNAEPSAMGFHSQRHPNSGPWSRLFIQVEEGAGGSSCYPTKHSP